MVERELEILVEVLPGQLDTPGGHDVNVKVLVTKAVEVTRLPRVLVREPVGRMFVGSAVRMPVGSCVRMPVGRAVRIPVGSAVRMLVGS